MQKLRQYSSIIIAIFGFLFLFSLSGRLVETVEADEVVVIQDPIDGELHFHFTPGMKWQGFGGVTKYKKESQYWFSALKDQGGVEDRSIPIRFNDGGSARMSGSVRWKLPVDEMSMKKVHTLYGTQRAVEQQLIRTVMEKSVYMTGPLMSSKESYAERRNDLLSFIDDQASRGVYNTTTKEVKGADPLSGKEKTFTIVEIDLDTNGNFKRQEKSPLQEYGVSISNLALNKIQYNETVEKQIATQQNAIMEVQTAIAKAKEAEQDAIRAEKEGQAQSARAKWKQEVIKAQAVTEAEQQKEVAKLSMESAEYFKKEQILKGEGEAARKKLVMNADGALDKKLEAWVTVNHQYADAMKNYQGDWVPSIIMGGNGNQGGSNNGAEDFINLMMMKTAKDLSLDVSVPRGNQ